MHAEDIWDYWADRYEGLWVQKYSLRPTREKIIAELGLILEPEKKYRILDMGCGTGQLLRGIQANFADYDIDYTGVDISYKMIEAAKERSNGMNFIVSGVESFNAEDGLFDIVLCSHSFPYYRDKKSAIGKFHRMVKSGGYLFLAQASQNNLYDGIIMPFVRLTTSKARYPGVKEIQDLLAGKFAIRKTERIWERFYMPSIYMFAGQKL